MRRLTSGTKTLGWLLAAAVAVSVSAGCEIHAGEGDFSVDLWRGKAQDTWTRSYTVNEGGRLEILNVNGQVQAEAWTGATVEITVEREATAGSDDAAKELLDRIEMREEASPDRVRVETRAPRVSLGGVKTAYRIRVPKGVHVDLRTVNGGVRVDDLSGEVRASSTNGGVRGRIQQATLLEARTTNGGVDLELAGPVAPNARVALASVNGGISLTVPGDTRADVTARCVNGRIRIADELVFDAEGETSRRRVDGRLNGGGARIELQTTNGGVALGRS